MAGFRETTHVDLAIDHRVEVNTLTGVATLTIPIRTSPSRHSFAPALALAYQAGTPNAPFGLGWSLSGVAGIERDTALALPTYGEGDRFRYAGDELVACGRMEGGRWLADVAVRGAY